MKKRDKKLHLNRETVRQLDPRQLNADALVNARGGAELAADDLGRYSSCGRPDCC
ncbi:MAG TPA: class I lanthipeptide [Thermoanaerobaculia bacterium]|nr:class I lanthipeptide [Thermoanaerobaculia bacterium]